MPAVENHAAEAGAPKPDASIESIGNLGRRLTFSLPAAELDSQVDGRLREIARGAKIKGFRPGKVPASVIRQRYGAQVRDEVRENLLSQGFRDAVSAQSLRLAGNPQIRPADEAADGLDYVATFEVVPDFGEIEVDKLEVIRVTAEVADADIDAMIENLRAQRRTWNPVERAAQEGDAVELETWSQHGETRVPAEGVERGRAALGSGGMLPAIELALIGMKAGEEKQVEVEFPADWQVPQFAGKQVQVYLRAVTVSEPVLPEVDAQFIQSFGIKSGDAEQFRVEIRNNLERELKGALMTRLRREVGDKLIAAFSTVEMPPNLVELEARGMAQRAAEQARKQGRQIGDLPDDAYQGFLEAARNRVLVGLVVGEIARRNALKLDPKGVEETLRLIASTYEEPQQVIDLYRNDAQLMSNLQARVMEEQVTDWIAERARHTEQALPFSEAIRQ